MKVEFDALSPSVALIHYGTNDMGMGTTYASALPGFYSSMMELLDWLEDRGVLPVLTGISHRGDREAADWWVSAYNGLIRGMAQARQLPFIDLHLAMDPLANSGLASDGIHLNLGPYNACDLSSEALAYGYNMRNRIVLESLDRVKRVLVDGEEALDEPEDVLLGEGSHEAPFQIASLPFADSRDTREGERLVDAYPGCASDADESGPEWVYRLDLAETTRLRALVMDRGETDIDLHLLRDSGDGQACVERGHRMIETTVEAGAYFLVADTWVDAEGVERSGTYQLVVVTCEPEDPDC